jgi:hypothetical protein
MNDFQLLFYIKKDKVNFTGEKAIYGKLIVGNTIILAGLQIDNS